jgi:cyclic pyranopterin monophosphate synthase
MSQSLTHVNEAGEARMVDVSGKAQSRRVAVAEGTVEMGYETLLLIQDNAVVKGDVLAAARIAGIQAAKLTWQLIPLCHPILTDSVEVEFSLRSDGIGIAATVGCVGRTGVEMEALTAVSVAALTIYDMCKAVDKSMAITGIRLMSKTKEAVSAMPLLEGAAGKGVF